MYIFYERFMYKSNSSMYLNKSIYVNQVTCHLNPSRITLDKLRKKYGNISVSVNRYGTKVYIRIRARVIRVRYENSKPYSCPVIKQKWVDNYLLGYSKEINYEA